MEKLSVRVFPVPLVVH